MRKATMETVHDLAARAVQVSEDPTRSTACIVCSVALMTDQDAFCSSQCLCTFLGVVGQYVIRDYNMAATKRRNPPAVKLIDDAALEALEYHGCSSGTSTQPMVRDAILDACFTIRELRRELAHLKAKATTP